MYHLALVTLLLVTVTSFLSLLSLSAAAPALSLAVDVVCTDSTISVSTVLCAVTLYVDRVSSIVSENLIIARLARVWDVLSPLATGSPPPCVVVKLYGNLYQLLALSRSIDYPAIDALRITLKRSIPYLNALYSISAVLLAACVYVLLCGAPILVWYCLSFDEVITATLKPNPEPEPEPDFPYVTVRRRKLPRMLQEKHKREREQALQREAEREQVRLDSKHSKTSGSSTQPPALSSTEMHSHTTDKGDVCYSIESFATAPPTPIHEYKLEPCDIAIPASPCSSSYSPPTQTICLDSDASSTSAGPTTPTLCTSASTGYMPSFLITQDYERSDSLDRANISLNEGSDNKPESVAPDDARQDNLMNLTPPHSTLSASDQVASSLALQPEATTTHHLCIDVSRVVTPVATEVEAGITSQSKSENLVEDPVDLPKQFDAIVRDFLAIPGVPVLIQATTAELDSALAQGIDSLLLNQMTASEGLAGPSPEAGATGSHALGNNLDPNACLLDIDSAGRPDMTCTISLTQDTPCHFPTDIHMTTEQIHTALEVFEAELAGTNHGLPGLDFQVNLEAKVLPSSPASPVSDSSEDPALHALDAVWASLGVKPAEPEDMDINFDMMMMEIDSNFLGDERRNINIATDLDLNEFAFGESTTTSAANSSAQEAVGLDVEFGQQLSNEESSAILALAQLCVEGASTAVADMDFSDPPAELNNPITGRLVMDWSVQPATVDTSNPGDCDASMSEEECITLLTELCKDIVPTTNLEANLEKTLATLDDFMRSIDVNADVRDVGHSRFGATPSGSTIFGSCERYVAVSTDEMSPAEARLTSGYNRQLSDEECLAALVLAQLSGKDAGVTASDMHLREIPANFGATSCDALVPSGSPNLGETSMSDEECIALLTELCKGITPATDPEADLEKALAALDEIIGTTGRDAGGRGTSDTNSSITLSVIENDPTSTGWSGCMRLEDVIDCAMILDTALEVDPSESDDGLEYLATPKDVPMEVDEMLAKMEWKGEGTSEVQTMCPLEMLKQL